MFFFNQNVSFNQNDKLYIIIIVIIYYFILFIFVIFDLFIFI